MKRVVARPPARVGPRGSRASVGFSHTAPQGNGGSGSARRYLWRAQGRGLGPHSWRRALHRCSSSPRARKIRPRNKLWPTRSERSALGRELTILPAGAEASRPDRVAEPVVGEALSGPRAPRSRRMPQAERRAYRHGAARVVPMPDAAARPEFFPQHLRRYNSLSGSDLRQRSPASHPFFCSAADFSRVKPPVCAPLNREGPRIAPRPLTTEIDGRRPIRGCDALARGSSCGANLAGRTLAHV